MTRPENIVVSSVLVIVLTILTLRGCRAGTKAELINELLDPARYNGNVRPGMESGKPVLVYLDMYVNSISSVDEVEMEYVLSIFMRQRWIDDRLNYTEYDDDITLNYNMFDRLWVPDLFIKNEKKATFHQVTVPNRLIKLSPNGQIYYSQRLTLTLSCSMHLKYYPMDSQMCKIELESYGYTTKDLVFKWNEEKEPVQVSESFEMPEFYLVNTSVGDCTLEYITGSFTCKYATFRLKRQFAYYLIQTFVPSCLIVALSWVSFWIDAHAVPARVTLGLLTVLTITTQSSGISSSLPRVSYIKAIDIWMTCCLVFVFGALIEYSIVNVLVRKSDMAKKQRNERLEKAKSQDKNVKVVVDDEPTAANEADINSVAVKVSTNTESDVLKDIYGIETKRKSGRSCIAKIKESPALGVDMVSRAVFPGVFLIFNIIYWLTYKVDVIEAPGSH